MRPGQRVTHTIYGDGKFVEHSAGRFVRVRFDKPLPSIMLRSDNTLSVGVCELS